MVYMLSNRLIIISWYIKTGSGTVCRFGVFTLWIMWTRWDDYSARRQHKHKTALPSRLVCRI